MQKQLREEKDARECLEQLHEGIADNKIEESKIPEPILTEGKKSVD